MRDPIHRIEPRLLNTPMFYGSPGEPQLTFPSALAGPMPPMAYNNSFAPLLMGPLALGLMAASPSAGDVQMNRRSMSGVVRRPKRAGFDDLPFGKAFALARRMGLDQFNWKGNPYTTELK